MLRASHTLCMHNQPYTAPTTGAQLPCNQPKACRLLLSMLELGCPKQATGALHQTRSQDQKHHTMGQPAHLPHHAAWPCFSCQVYKLVQRTTH